MSRQAIAQSTNNMAGIAASREWRASNGAVGVFVLRRKRLALWPDTNWNPSEFEPIPIPKCGDLGGCQESPDRRRLADPCSARKIAISLCLSKILQEISSCAVDFTKLMA